MYGQDVGTLKIRPQKSTLVDHWIAIHILDKNQLEKKKIYLLQLNIKIEQSSTYMVRLSFAYGKDVGTFTTRPQKSTLLDCYIANNTIATKNTRKN